MHCPQLSDTTQEYLARYCEILDNMISGMTAAKLTESISHNFIVQMIPHHEAAIQMSENILQYTTPEPLQRIAQNIITMQTESIASMKAALEDCGEQTNTQRALCLYQERYRNITQTMFSRMKTARATNQIDADFMREMIPHHQGAVGMSENALRYPICPQLVPILNDIITSQTRGIAEMQRLLCTITA